MTRISRQPETDRGVLDWFLIGVVALSVITVGATLGHIFSHAAGLPFRAAAVIGRYRPGPGARMVVGALAALAVVLAALGAWRGVRVMRRRTPVRPPADEDELGLSMLGGLSRADGIGDSVLLDPAEHAARPFSDLRQAVDFANLRYDARTLMLTGTGSPAARSTLVANLAVAFGRTGRRVVLVDADFEQPQMHALFDVPEAPGIRELVHGTATLETSLRSLPLGGELPLLSIAGRSHLTPPGSLYVLTAGEHGPDDGADMLGSPRLAELVGFLGGYFDLVLVTAPASAATGSTGLSAVVGGVLVVVEGDLGPGAERSQLKRMLEKISAPKLGMIVAGAAAG